jgi:outer membrane protein assembly factor BamE (lipoprotein component of BamABCDE complex)
MKRWYLILIPVAFLAVLRMVHVRSPDGIDGLILACVLRADTEYGKGYTDAGFKKIQVGQTAEEVRNLLGEPVWIARGRGGQRWMYSQSPTSTHYRYREVRFINGKVLEKRSHFYFD